MEWWEQFFVIHFVWQLNKAFLRPTHLPSYSKCTMQFMLQDLSPILYGPAPYHAPSTIPQDTYVRTRGTLLTGTRVCTHCVTLTAAHTDLLHQFLLQLDDLVLQTLVEALDVVQGASLSLQHQHTSDVCGGGRGRGGGGEGEGEGRGEGRRGGRGEEGGAWRESQTQDEHS